MKSFKYREFWRCLYPFKASHYMLRTLRISAHKAARMHQTSRHKSAVKETLNSAITLPAALHKLQEGSAQTDFWHLLSTKLAGRKSFLEGKAEVMYPPKTSAYKIITVHAWQGSKECFGYIAGGTTFPTTPSKNNSLRCYFYLGSFCKSRVALVELLQGWVAS